MKKSLILFSLAVSLTACNSSDISGNAPASQNPVNSITIATDPREGLTQIPGIEFNGRYETTARPDLGTGGTTGSGDTALSSSSAPESATDGATADSIVIPGYPGQSIEPGTLTAGDYDDHLNPALYQTYASEYLQRRGQAIDIPRMDFNHRILIEVTDQAGLPYADARVSATASESQETIEFHTAANGITSLYNELDALPEDFVLRVTGTNGTFVEQQINRQQATQAGKILVTLDRGNQTQSPAIALPLDLMFVIDSTGSMGDELNFIQTELSDIINSVTSQQSDINIGLVFYRDYGDQYIVRAHDFTASLNNVQLNLNEEQASGGGDYPEAMDQALQSALSASWRNNSRKVLFLVADAPPHGDRMRATWNAAEQARLNNIHIVPVAASGVGEDAEYIMRSAAALTNSRYLFLTDDSGFGNTHAEPEIDCYVVTSLRHAMIRTLNSLVTGTRTEPTANDIIRQVGDYNDGVCSPQHSNTDTVESSVLVERQHGGTSGKRVEVITDQSTLNTRLTEYGEQPVDVDFTAGQVILVDMGPKNTGGYSIDIASIEEYNNHVTANVVFQYPGANCAVTLALTHPFSFIVVETTKELRTTSNTVSRECDF